jgi:hypothetical protein
MQCSNRRATRSVRARGLRGHERLERRVAGIGEADAPGRRAQAGRDRAARTGFGQLERAARSRRLMMRSSASGRRPRRAGQPPKPRCGIRSWRSGPGSSIGHGSTCSRTTVQSFRRDCSGRGSDQRLEHACHLQPERARPRQAGIAGRRRPRRALRTAGSRPAGPARAGRRGPGVLLQQLLGRSASCRAAAASVPSRRVLQATSSPTGGLRLQPVREPGTPDRRRVVAAERAGARGPRVEVVIVTSAGATAGRRR